MIFRNKKLICENCVHFYEGEGNYCFVKKANVDNDDKGCDRFIETTDWEF